MSSSNLIFLVVTSFYTLLSLIYLIKSLRFKFQDKLICLTLLIYSLFFLSRVLWFNLGFIATNQTFLGVFSPIMVIPAPLFYLAVRNIALGVDVFKKNDLIHFLPALIIMIDLIPFYMMSNEEKQQVVNSILMSYSDIHVYIVGFIPSIYIHFLRLAIIIFYFFLALDHVVKTERILEMKNNDYKRWLKSTLLFLFLLKSLVIIFSISTLYVRVYDQEMPIFHGVLFALFFIVISAYVLGNYIKLNLPQNIKLASLNKKSVKGNHKLMGLNHEIMISSQFTEHDFKEKLKLLIEKDKVFLNKEITSTSLAKLVGVNFRELPALLNETYSCNFKELMNKFRITYAIKKIRENYLDLQTIEALGEVCGYNSRITFFNAFKKENGFSPNEYWKKYQNGEESELED